MKRFAPIRARSLIGALAGVLILSSLLTTASAAPLSVMTLNGQLLSKGGVAVPDGSYTLTVSFYAGKADTKALGSEVIPVKTAAGAFTATLGLKTALPAKQFYSGAVAWIGVQVDADPELARIPASHVAYALRADVASQLQCSGCVKGAQIDPGVFSAYALKKDLSFAKADQKCAAGSAIVGFDTSGTLVCAKYTAPASTLSTSQVNNLKAGKLATGAAPWTNQSCAKGSVVVGLDGAGKVVCAADKFVETIYTAGTGVVISKQVVSLNVGYADGRYVNTGELNAVTSAMIKDGAVAAADLANNAVSGAKVLDSSLTGSDVKNGSLTGADLATGTITGTQVADGSLTGADVKDGTLTYQDTNVGSIQRRVAGACQPGQAIRSISSTGTVVCESALGDEKVVTSAPVVNGNWYRIASSGGGHEVAGTFTVWDTSTDAQVRFRVGVSSGNATGMSYSLLSHSYGSSGTLFDSIRVAEGGSSSAHFVDVKVKSNGTLYAKMSHADHEHKWTLLTPKSVGTSSSVSGYSSRIYPLSTRLASVGDYLERFSVDRGGIARVHGSSGFIELSSNSSTATISTDRAKVSVLKPLSVTGDATVSGNALVAGDVRAGAGASTGYRLSVSDSKSSGFVAGVVNTYSSDTRVYMGGYSAGLYVKTATGDTTTGYIASFGNNSGTAMTIDSNRRVGINTASPGYSLEVNGSFQADSITVGSTSLASYIDNRVRNYVRTQCYVWLGWRDSCDGCTSSPSKYGRMRGDGACSVSGSANTCIGGGSSAWAGVNTDGDVNGDDKFYIRFYCY